MAPTPTPHPKFLPNLRVGSGGPGKDRVAGGGKAWFPQRNLSHCIETVGLQSRTYWSVWGLLGGKEMGDPHQCPCIPFAIGE